LGKRQRIRDPIHNLIEFDDVEFERTMWDVIQTRPFQRLRRVRQLGFSDYVYPGATHSRLAHSLGVFQTARKLMEIIKRHQGDLRYEPRKADTALAAALVHDVGHGMFSHAFEDVGKKLDLKMAEHELVSDALIREGEIADALNKNGSGFANDVAEVIGSPPKNLYGAVVSSQFDADRLDYMQRDRIMTGVQNSAIDFKWLMANIEIAEVSKGVDDLDAGKIETFILGPKALYAADTYVLSLFQLYPTVYFHKATRSAQKMFTALMIRIIELVRDNGIENTGLHDRHPICRFAKNPDSIDNVLNLDDTVFWGALPLLAEANDPCIHKLATRFQSRNLYKCIDVREKLFDKMEIKSDLSGNELRDKLKQLKKNILTLEKRFDEWSEKKSCDEPLILTDTGQRDMYATLSEKKGPWNQMRIRKNGAVMDMVDSSSIVRSDEKFEFFRAYVSSGDGEAAKEIERSIDGILKGG